MAESDPTLDRLEDQLAWYEKKTTHSHRVFTRIKVFEITAAALIPFLSAIDIPEAYPKAWVIGGLGVLITIFEGLLQLNQYQRNWIIYRSTCEALKHEKYLYLAGAGPYANVANPKVLLADRVESLISQEHAKWATVQQQPTKPVENATQT